MRAGWHDGRRALCLEKAIWSQNADMATKSVILVVSRGKLGILCK